MPCSAIYIHWPYCEVKCPYCDFNSFSKPSGYDKQIWIKAYKAQLDYFISNVEMGDIKTIFLGGGTPSLMPLSILEEIFDYIHTRLNVSREVEYTFEANPSSVEKDKFIDFRTLGFNRVSIGVQSFSDEILQFLGRAHSAQEGVEAICHAQKVFNNYSFDLIYGTARHNVKQWRDELNLAKKLQDKHISCYQLTIERGTEFYRLLQQNKLPILDSDKAYEFYTITNDILDDQGLKQYEISNYAKEDFECKHNIGYWQYNQYIGIGPGAHSRIATAGKLYAIMTYHKPEKWLSSCVKQNSRGIQNNTLLTSEEVISEQLMMGLRLIDGIDMQRSNTLAQGYGTRKIESYFNQEKFREYIEADLLVAQYDVKQNIKNIKLTKKGLALHSYLVPRLLMD